MKAELVSEVQSIAPGRPFWAALALTMEDGWHVNWRNPGDAGLPPKIVWDLPEGFTAGEIQWPYPERIALPRLVDYGYHGSVLLPVRIVPPDDLTPGREVLLAARVDWLACANVCIPGEARLSLIIPVTGSPRADTRWAQQIRQALGRVPDTAFGWQVTAGLDETEITLQLVRPMPWPGAIEGVFFAPFASDLIAHAAPQTITRYDKGLTIEMTRSRSGPAEVQRVAGVLYNPSGWDEHGNIKAITLDVPIDPP